jgi:putative membrane protein
VSDLNDPRVLFAAERTLLAWSRTVVGLMAFGFLIERTGVLLEGKHAAHDLSFWVGLAFVVLGVVLSVLSVIQYRRAIASLRPVEIPVSYWVNLPVFMSAAVGLFGLALAAALVTG